MTMAILLGIMQKKPSSLQVTYDSTRPQYDSQYRGTILAHDSIASRQELTTMFELVDFAADIVLVGERHSPNKTRKRLIIGIQPAVKSIFK